MNKKYNYNWPDKQSKFENLLEKLEDKIQSFYNIFNRFWFDKRKQRVKIEIHDHDIWSADYTLSLIIVPILEKLKDLKHGAPFTDIEDVPEELKPTGDDPVDMTDNTHFQRWDWILDEMVWSFKQIRDDNYTEKYLKFEDDPNDPLSFKPSYEDREGLERHEQRINNGLRLFGKYFRHLWS